MPTHVRQAFDGYLKCGRLECGFLRLRCDTSHAEHLILGPVDAIADEAAGTTHVIFEPLDFIARLAALVPPPRRGRDARPTKPVQTENRTPAEQQAAMRWAKRLKVDVETCPSCGGTVKVIASIEDPPVIERILNHLARKDLPGLWAESRAPPAKRTGLHH